MKIENTYTSGPLADTDLHAGLFFGIIYTKTLSFHTDGKVILTKKVINSFSPMDIVDIEMKNNYKAEGTYFINKDGNLVCKFESKFLEMTGTFTDDSQQTLIMHEYNNRIKMSWSAVYYLR
ncbi:MAG TPA: hypothetical protein VK177_09675 [Flavobacteriales bacterium]|nr:hypothetical protein [Flavobacteriales bacterium]